MSEKQVITGVEKILKGLTDLVETLEPSDENATLWRMIREAEDEARRRTR